MTQEQTDEELMLSYQQGDFKAFDKLYARYSCKVYGFLKKRVRNAPVDDIHQAVWTAPRWLESFRHNCMNG
jgi:hypothetical protein